MNETLLTTLILGPIVFGALCLVAPGKVRDILIVAAAAVTTAAGVWLATCGTLKVPAFLDGNVVSAIELGVVVLILAIAVRIKSPLIALLAVAQAGMAAWEMFLPHHAKAETAAFLVDPLSIILVLITCIIGSLIVLYAIGYMKDHEHHAPATARRTGTFFFFLVGFLGAMNGLVLANDLKWLSIFWELTTICSFVLIGHDGTPEARTNAKRALLINSFGGAAMIAAGLIAAAWGGTSALSDLTPACGGKLIGTMCLALMAVAAFTKSAQMPFQSWLLGAMVAPTPVSALLHSATMVNAGVYVLLRMAPAYVGTTRLMDVIALGGAFTFALTSALACGQSNGKKVLAYSTIANLGLIVTCAGIGTPLAYSAALMILCFHAASKGLLFLCMGTIEQQIGSRDIEDMGSLLREMPYTTIITVVGMASMLIPPFGMLLSKWMAMEAAVHSLTILFLLVIGSALTVMFWAKWIGRITTVSYHPKYTIETLQTAKRLTMLVLGIIVILAGLAAVPAYGYVIEPITRLAMKNVKNPDFAQMVSAGRFLIWPFGIFLGLTVVVAYLTFKKVKPSMIRSPFLCGENIEGSQKTYEFRSAMDQGVHAWMPSIYMKNIFDEAKLTLWANPVAWVILIAMFGVLKSMS